MIDNIFTIKITQDNVSGNASGYISASISDHLPQFSIIPEIFSNFSKIFERNWSSFDQHNFILEFLSIDWEQNLKLDEKDMNESFQLFIDKIDLLLDTYSPYKKVSKYKMKFKIKPWLSKRVT